MCMYVCVRMYVFIHRPNESSIPPTQFLLFKNNNMSKNNGNLANEGKVHKKNESK